MTHSLTRIGLFVSILFSVQVDAEVFRFRGDDPISVDHDDLPGPMPQTRKLEDQYDVLENIFFPGGDDALPRALNINTLGEVPQSSWYTDRLGSGGIERAALTRGPDVTDGPAPGIWTIVGAKSQGITPGFRIKDEDGNLYLIKFDPPANPEMATAAEVISTKLFYALGYNVPQNQIVTFTPAQLRLSATATVVDAVGREVKMTDELLAQLLARVAHNPDGSIRALASKFLPGKPVGPFLFHGTRGDDLNDLFPHEHRRELRAYGVFCAWLNHDDSRAVNTLDIYVGTPGEGHIRHYLIDFGSTLGSGSVQMQGRRAGNEYFLEPRQVVKGLFGFGFWLRPWVRFDYPDLPSIGRFEADYFQPELWRPEYANVAFDHMDLEDAWWAAKRVMRFSDDDLRAVVAIGQLSDPVAAEYLFDCLRKRRDKIGSYWLPRLSSLDGFRVEGRVLHFHDLLVQTGLEPVGASYAASVAVYDNPLGTTTVLDGSVAVTASSVTLPDAVDTYIDGSFFCVTLTNDKHRIDVFLRKRDGHLDIVGIDRHAAHVPATEHSRIAKRVP